MKKLVVLTGAGISAESGISTFRDANGLWEGNDIMEVASISGWHKNPSKVNEFYNARRRQLKEVKPNDAHYLLKDLETYFDVHIITQNVDNLHEVANSTNILHLHGELNKVRPENSSENVINWEKDLTTNDTINGIKLRPHIVWFGEQIPLFNQAIEICSKADILLIIGTSLQVYPAASLFEYVSSKCLIYYIDKNPAENVLRNSRIITFSKTATSGLKYLKELLIEMA